MMLYKKDKHQEIKSKLYKNIINQSCRLSEIEDKIPVKAQVEEKEVLEKSINPLRPIRIQYKRNMKT